MLARLSYRVKSDKPCCNNAEVTEIKSLIDIISLNLRNRGTHQKGNNSVSEEFELEAQGNYCFSRNYGLIIVHNQKHMVKFDSIKLFYTNGQAKNKHEIQLTERTENVAYMARLTTPTAKFYEFCLKGLTDRNILQNEFHFAGKYSLISIPDTFISNFKVSIPYFKSRQVLEFTKIPFFNEKISCDRKQITLKRNEQITSKHVSNPYYHMPLEDKVQNFKYLYLKHALNQEDLANVAAYDKFTLSHQRIFVESENRGIYSIDTYHLGKKSKELKLLSKELSLCITDNKYLKNDPTEYYKTFFWSGKEIQFEHKPHIRHERSRRSTNIFSDQNNFYDIRFIPNRSSHRVCYNALECMEQYGLTRFFEEFKLIPGHLHDFKPSKEKVEKFEWFDDKISTNEEQMTAIKNVVNCTAFPLPFVIFGPPGTGKTSTLVECVAQIMLHKPNSHILISAQSNSACDEIGKRLTKTVSYHKILRYQSTSIIKSSGPKEMQNISNSQCPQNNPSYEELYHFNIVIITLSTSSRLVQANIKKGHFEYIFIDECGAATEPESLVPIIGLGADYGEITTNLVLLGDHKQLGPVLVSDYASNLGLSVSLLERVMLIQHARNPNYDNNYVVQLLDNYRNHPAILQFSNTEFYDNKLRSKMSNEDRKITENFSFLTDKSFPIVFHSVLTPNEVDSYQTSSHNIGEIKIVKLYVDLLMKTKIGDKNVDEFDIGIVSPYKSQLSKLHETFKNLKNIEIGTAEYYQGREKRIIIISTVRSENSVGFLKSEKRLNVMITRAKSLLIIVGNPETLQKDKLWRQFINFCSQNNAFAGEPFKQKILTDVEEESVEKLSNALNQLKADAEKTDGEEEEEEVIFDQGLKKRLMDLQNYI